MNIALFTDSFLPHVSGVSSTVINQANALARRGHSLLIFRPRATGVHHKNVIERSGELHARIRDVPLSLPTRHIPDLRVAIPTVAPNLPALRRFKPDVIHVHTEWGCGWEGVWLAKMMQRPLVGTFHTFFAEPEYLRQFKLPDNRISQKMIWRYSVFFYNHCERILSPSLSVAEQLVARGIQHTPHLLSNGIPDIPLCPEADLERDRQRLGLPRRCVAYVGRLAAEKSLPVLMRAFAACLKQEAELGLILIGDGPQRDELEALAAELNIAHAVFFLGRIDHQELIDRNVFRLAQLLVLPSRTENQPVSILEAMAQGLPVVGADARGIPEMIEPGENGLLFAPEQVQACSQAMLRLLQDPSLWQHCSQGAFAFAAENNIHSVAGKLEGHYESVIEARAGRKRRRERLQLLRERASRRNQRGQESK